ncbi:MAG: OmpA family protein [Saprospiraceae bacterium]
MRKTYLLACLVYVMTTGVYAQELLRKAIYFDTDQYQLTKQAQQTLDELVSQTYGLGDYQLEVLAHTDDRGAADYNRELAEKRALSAQTYLTSLGILVEKTTLKSFGEENPTYANDEDGNRALNRRVDLILTARTIESLGDLMTDLAQGRTQSFSFKAGEAVKINGKGGTTVWIDENALVFEDGTYPEGEVTFALKEAYSYTDMVLDGLSTHSGDQQLETGGMLYLSASADGRPLQLQNGQNLVVGMPTPAQLEGMQLFTAVQNQEGKVADWTPTGQNFGSTLEAILKDLPPKPEMPRLWLKPPHLKLDLSNEPLEPKKPLTPYRPVEPKRESIHYQPGFLKRMVLGKEKLIEKEEEMYARKMEEYKQRVERYKARVITYKEEIATYEDRLVAYQAAKIAWDKNLDQQRENFHQSPEFLAFAEKKQKSEAARLKIYSEKLEKWESNKAAQLALFETKYANIGFSSKAMTMNYFYQVNNLGWINCDRFSNTPEADKMPLAVADSDQLEEEIFVVFKDIKSMMRAYKAGDKNTYMTQAAPKDAAIRIIGIKVIDGRAQLAVKDTTVGAMPQHTLDFKPSSMQSIRKALNDLNS